MQSQFCIETADGRCLLVDMAGNFAAGGTSAWMWPILGRAGVLHQCSVQRAGPISSWLLPARGRIPMPAVPCAGFWGRASPSMTCLYWRSPRTGVVCAAWPGHPALSELDPRTQAMVILREEGTCWYTRCSRLWWPGACVQSGRVG